MREVFRIALVAVVVMVGACAALAQSSGGGGVSGQPQVVPPATSDNNPGSGDASGAPKVAPAQPGNKHDSMRQPAPRGCRYRERKLELIV